MSSETQQSLLVFSENILTSLSKGPLSVTWFGGEPLLALGTIRELTQHFKRLATTLGISTHFSLITNGYHLNLLNPAILAELQLSYIQVTIDGPAHVHNQRRPLRNAGSTYDTILQNIATISRFTSAIVIRINVDYTNYNDVPLLLNELKQKAILDCCTLQPACVDASTGTCSAHSCHSLTGRKWGEVENFIYAECKRLGIADRIQNRYPEPWSLACSAQVKNALVIDPQGNIYKCLNDAALPERAIGNINHDRPLNWERANKFAKFTPFGREACEVCKFLPLCNGGCPSASIDHDESAYRCTHLKFSFRERLNQYMREYVDGRE
jgi:uncharacterized protein